ncbi:MAG TPA: 2-polyprenyl-3-methyl-6-methoxy-1,4-benzoquinone monooxygenase [Burkholderiales bacterium]
MLDTLITQFDQALRALAVAPFHRLPAGAIGEAQAMPAHERARAAALMRVNHTGEICAQALYHGQSLLAKDPAVRTHMRKAAAEEGAHLAWTSARIDALGGHRSLLNPFWYAGSFAVGAFAASLGDPVSLGFVSETERQVEAHLDDQIARLPIADQASRSVLQAMREDEVRHGREARAAGGLPLPWPARLAMKAAAKVMTTVAYRI